MTDIVLVHGAWHGGWCWQKLSRTLEARGHRVLAPDMPGHGADTTPRSAVNLAAYTRRLAEVLEPLPAPAVLLGHSMGGMLISSAAEAVPERIRKLIYLCAFVPRNGDAMMEVATRVDDRSTLRSRLIPVENGTATIVPDELIEPTFYHDCDAADIRFAKARLVPQPLAPMTDIAALTDARFGSIDKAYIECLQDAAISIGAQRRMIDRGGITEVVTLDTSHSPFFSAPETLADAIESMI